MSVRLRLTVLYGGILVLAGAALLAITYVLVARALPSRSIVASGAFPDGLTLLAFDGDVTRVLDQEAAQQRSAALRELLVQGSLAFALMTAAAAGAGWVIAGRVLRPLRRVIDTAHRLGVDRLHERIPEHRTNDEFKDLSATFNAMLARL
jgi:HAMP domain-containing protein